MIGGRELYVVESPVVARMAGQPAAEGRQVCWNWRIETFQQRNRLASRITRLKSVLNRNLKGKRIAGTPALKALISPRPKRGRLGNRSAEPKTAMQLRLRLPLEIRAFLVLAGARIEPRFVLISIRIQHRVVEVAIDQAMQGSGAAASDRIGHKAGSTPELAEKLLVDTRYSETASGASTVSGRSAEDRYSPPHPTGSSKKKSAARSLRHLSPLRSDYPP